MKADYFVHGFHRLSHFLDGQKVTKEPPGTHGSRSLLHLPGHPVAGVGVFDWIAADLVSASSIWFCGPTAVFHPRKDAASADILTAVFSHS